jgi:hypothetical protein
MMTREEAMERISICGYDAGKWIDAFVALGMLKLDDPVREKAIDCLEPSHGKLAAINAVDRLLIRGFKITR